MGLQIGDDIPLDLVVLSRLNADQPERIKPLRVVWLEFQVLQIVCDRLFAVLSKPFVEFAQKSIGRCVIRVEFGRPFGFAHCASKVIHGFQTLCRSFHIGHPQPDIGGDKGLVQFLGCLKSLFGSFVIFCLQIRIPQLRLHLDIVGFGSGQLHKCLDCRFE